MWFEDIGLQDLLVDSSVNEGNRKVKGKESEVATPWTVVYKAPLSMGFSRQGYWSGLPLPSPK